MKSPAFAVRPLLSCVACAVAGFLPLVSRAAEAEAGKAPIVSSDAMVQKELTELDKAINLNPKLEELISANIDRLTESAFRAQNPEIDALLKKQPDLPKALKLERHFLIHRAIARLSRSKVTRDDAKALDQFLEAHPDIRRDLEKRPGQIVQQDFLIKHPQLGHFFETHPALSTVLLQQADKQAEKKAAGKAPEKK